MKSFQNKIILFIIIATTFYILFSCSENPHQLTLNIYNNDIEGVVKDTILYATRDTTYFIKSKVSTTTSNRLLLGESYGVTARPIIRYTNFISVPDSVIIDSAKIRLTANGYIAETATPSLTVTVFPVLNLWSSNRDSVWNDYESNIDRSKPLAESELTPSDSGAFFFNFNSDGIDLVNKWYENRDNSNENYGVLFDFASANYLQYIHAITSLKDPELIVFYNLPDDTVNYSDTLYASMDAFIYEGNVPINDDKNYVSSLIIYNSIYEFDIRSLLTVYTNEITLIAAAIQVPVDLDKSLIDSRFGVSSMVTIRLLSNFEDSSVKVDSTIRVWASHSQWASDSSYIETNSGSAREVLAKSIIRPILSEPETSQSLAISFIDLIETSSKITDENDFYSFIAFVKRQDLDQTSKPRLWLSYWVPPSPRL
jgi:hypothetical protein